MFGGDPDFRFLTSALEEFEAACDEAIARLGGGHAYTIFNQRRERAGILDRCALTWKDPGDLPDYTHRPEMPFCHACMNATEYCECAAKKSQAETSSS